MAKQARQKLSSWSNGNEGKSQFPPLHGINYTFKVCLLKKTILSCNLFFVLLNLTFTTGVKNEKKPNSYKMATAKIPTTARIKLTIP